MKTLLLSFMQKHTSDGLTFRGCETRQAAVVEPPSLSLCNTLFRYLAGFLLVGAAVLGHISPAQANHSVAPFGIHCDSVGPDGTAYVPGVDENALAEINALEAALGQPITQELPLSPSDLDRIPQLKSRLLVTLDSLGLKDTPVTTLTGADWTEIRAQTPQPGNLDGNEFYFAVLLDVTHEYPNGNNNPPLQFNLPDRVWPFFVQHPMP